MRILLRSIFLVILFSSDSSCQQIIRDTHLWELHINYWAPRVSGDKSFVYPYMLKRNKRDDKRSGAWRAMLSPTHSISNDASKWDTIFNYTNGSSSEFRPMVQAGYEFHKWLGNSLLYYGADIGWRTATDILISHDYAMNNGTITISERKLRKEVGDSWCAGFLGMEYYIGKRFSLSIESQIQLNYNTNLEIFSYAGEVMYRDKEINMQVIPFSYYLFNLSYNF